MGEEQGLTKSIMTMDATNFLLLQQQNRMEWETVRKEIAALTDFLKIQHLNGIAGNRNEINEMKDALTKLEINQKLEIEYLRAEIEKIKREATNSSTSVTSNNTESKKSRRIMDILVNSVNMTKIMKRKDRLTTRPIKGQSATGVSAPNLSSQTSQTHLSEVMLTPISLSQYGLQPSQSNFESSGTKAIDKAASVPIGVEIGKSDDTSIGEVINKPGGAEIGDAMAKSTTGDVSIGEVIDKSASINITEATNETAVSVPEVADDRVDSTYKSASVVTGEAMDKSSIASIREVSDEKSVSFTMGDAVSTNSNVVPSTTQQRQSFDSTTDMKTMKDIPKSDTLDVRDQPEPIAVKIARPPSRRPKVSFRMRSFPLHKSMTMNDAWLMKGQSDNDSDAYSVSEVVSVVTQKSRPVIYENEGIELRCIEDEEEEDEYSLIEPRVSFASHF